MRPNTILPKKKPECMQQTRSASDRQSCIDENNTKRRH